jgi:hypothetical protein
MPLYNSFECLEIYTENDGRVAMIVLEKELIKALVVNVYCPNDHKVSYMLIEKVFDKNFELLDKHPYAFVILGRDFNAHMSVNVFLNIH